MIVIPATAPPWAHQMASDFSRELDRLQPGKSPARLMPCSKADLPDAAKWRRSWIFVEDEVGGPTPAYSDGVNWLRAADRAIVS